MIERIHILAFLFLILISCNTENAGPDYQKIDRALKTKNEIYVTEILGNCKNEMIRKAEVYVDSLIIEIINLQLSDSIFFPEKPLKPQYQGPVIISDTVIARPIFPIEIKQHKTHEDTTNL